MRLFLLWSAAVVLAAGEAAPKPRPAVHELKQGDWTLLVALPDAANPWFANQQRFDWTGLVVHARKGDAVIIGKAPGEDGVPGLSLGTSDEFKTGYALDGEDPAAAQRIARIGIGVLALQPPPADKPKAKPKRALAQAAPTTVEPGDGTIVFAQDQPVETGIGWRLEKRISFLPDGSGFAIARKLVNTGTTPLVNQWYCHHWMRPGGQPGTGTIVTWPFAPQFSDFKPDTFTSEGGRMVIGRWSGAFFVIATGFRTAEDNRVTVEVPGSGMALTITGDWTPPKHAVYLHGEICPEPFLDIDLAPAAGIAWTTTYRVESR